MAGGHTLGVGFTVFDPRAVPAVVFVCGSGERYTFFTDAAYTRPLVSVGDLIGIHPFANGTVKASVRDAELHVVVVDGDLYGRGEVESTFRHRWDRGRYRLFGVERAVVVERELAAIDAAATAGDVELTLGLLERFDWGGGYGARFFQLPEPLSKKLWLLVHQHALRHHWEQHRDAARRLVERLLAAVMVSPPAGAEERFYDFGMEALDRDPTLLVPLSNCAFFLEQGGAPAAAIGILERALAVAPDRAVTHLNLADALWQTGAEGRAQEHYARYLTLRAEQGGGPAIPARVRERARGAPR